jgi:hypothetical protein
MHCGRFDAYGYEWKAVLPALNPLHFEDMLAFATPDALHEVRLTFPRYR